MQDTPSWLGVSGVGVVEHSENILRVMVDMAGRNVIVVSGRLAIPVIVPAAGADGENESCRTS